jgi:hypothetical protein
MSSNSSGAQTTSIYCRRCAYNLAGLLANTCPECGLAFSRNNPKSYSNVIFHPARRRAKRVAVLILSLVFIAGMALLAVFSLTLSQAECGYQRVVALPTFPNVTQSSVESQLEGFWRSAVDITDIPSAWRPGGLYSSEVIVVKYTTLIPVQSIHCVYDSGGRLIYIIPTYE